MQASLDAENYGSFLKKDAEIDATMQSRDSKNRLWMLVVLLCVATLGEGYDMGVLNGAIVRMKEHFDLSPREVGFVVAITPMSTLIGAGVHSVIADRFGRRPALLLTVVLLMVGPLTMALGNGIYTILFGRSICGVGIGGGLLIVTMMITEISPTAKRGRLVACEEVALNLGMVFGFYIGWLFLGIEDDWRWMLGVGCVLPMPLACVLLAIYCTGAEDTAIIPETPRWLAKQGRYESAKVVLERYQDAAEAREKIMELQTSSSRDADFVSWSSFLYLSKDRPPGKMMTACILVAVGEMICGATSVAYYSNSIMQEELGTSAAFFATVIMGVVRVFGVIVATLSVDDVGRRTLLLISASVMTIACVWTSVFAQLRAAPVMLPIGLSMMMLGFVIGCGSVSLMYIAEAFPTRFRGKGMAICMFWCRLAGGCSAMAYPMLVDCCGVSFTFFLQALVNLTLLISIYFFVPETKGLSLEEIHCLFE
mmetsp:Transcript_10323/g.16427  ORF Transcript_10323/g.16427 Transcript_10323/m.16427 type:complete len:481 (+) Transcript_10323:154-1596(+)